MPNRIHARHSNARRLAFQPNTYQGFQQGINKLANAIRPTLGPRPRMVAIDRILDDRMPELLDNGGVIAKRIIQLPGWRENVGAMYLRDVLWRLHNKCGDGTATAAVLFQFVYNEGVRYIVSGGNAMQMRTAFETGVKVIIEQLTRMTLHISGKEFLARIAESVCYDSQLARILGEVFDIVGEYGRIEIRKGHNRELEREYLEGMYWERGFVSRKMISNPDHAWTEMYDAAILISDLEITEPQQLFPVLEVALKAKIHALLIVADKLSDKSTGFLLANNKPEHFHVVAVRTPGTGSEEKAAALKDLSILTGGRSLIKAAGDTLDVIQADDFGYARRIWADQNNFGIVGGKGKPRTLREHIHTLRTAYNNSDEVVAREALMKRIGKLLGGSATVRIGGATELQIEERLGIAQRTVSAIRGAIMDGVVLGGGVALLGCRPALRRLLDQSTDEDERAAFRILIDAMAEPLRTIATNAGYNDREILAQIDHAGFGYGLDVISGQVRDMGEVGIYDSGMTQKSAVYAGINSAALALTIDVLIHCGRESPLQAINGPGKRMRL